MRNNIIYNNEADTQGGGLWECDGNIENNTIYGNTAPSDEGGGLKDCAGTIRNNIIWGNTGGQIVDSSDPTYCSIEGDPEGEGNTDQYPKFDPSFISGEGNLYDNFDDGDLDGWTQYYSWEAVNGYLTKTSSHDGGVYRSNTNPDLDLMFSYMKETSDTGHTATIYFRFIGWPDLVYGLCPELSVKVLLVSALFSVGC